MPTNQSLAEIIGAPQQGIEAGQTMAMQTDNQALKASQNLQQGLHTGMQLAQTQQDVETKKKQVEQMQQHIDETKWNSFKSRTAVAMAAPEKVQGKLLDQLGKWMGNQGMDPTIADALKDPEFKLLYAKAMKYESKNPTEAADGLQALNTLQTFMPGVAQMAEKHMSLTESSNMKTAAMANQRTIADNRNTTAIAVAEKRASPRLEALHRQNMQDMAKDKFVLQSLNQYSNLDNAIKNMQNGVVPTHQAFDELQQSVRSNLGIKGTSGVNERAKTYMMGLGFKPGEIAQFFSMKPQDIRDYGGTEFLDHVFALANSEQNNIRQKVDQRIKVLASSKKHFYDANPQFKEDLDNFIDMHGTQFGDKLGGTAEPQAPATAASLPKAGAAATAVAPDLKKRAAQFGFNLDKAIRDGQDPAAIDAMLKKLEAQARR